MTHANFEFGDDRMLPTPLDGYGLTWPPPASRARTLLGPRVTRERGARPWNVCTVESVCRAPACRASSVLSVFFSQATPWTFEIDTFKMHICEDKELLGLSHDPGPHEHL